MGNSIPLTGRTAKALAALSVLLLTTALAYGLAPKAEAAIATHVVISEVQIDSVIGTGGTADDFVELYNPTDAAVDLSAWSLQKTTGTGTSQVRVNLAGSIPSHGFFLVTRSDATSTLVSIADVVGSTSFSIAANNVVYLVNNQENIADATDLDIVDLVGLGEATIFETSAAANPDEGASIERKSGETHDDAAGNGWDTNNNLADFVKTPVSLPQNSLSATEAPVDESPEEEPEEQPEEEPEDEPSEDPEEEPSEDPEDEPEDEEEESENEEDEHGGDPEDEPGDDEDPEEDEEDEHGDDEEENEDDNLNFFQRIYVKIVSKFLGRGHFELPHLPRI